MNNFKRHENSFYRVLGKRLYGGAERLHFFVCADSLENAIISARRVLDREGYVLSTCQPIRYGSVLKGCLKVNFDRQYFCRRV